MKAWEYLIECEIHSLPINILELQNKQLGYDIMPYSRGWGLIQSMNLVEYAKKHTAFTANVDESIIIFYNQGNILDDCDLRIVIAHEIGHIVCGHTTYSKIVGCSENELEELHQEHEADMWAISFLAPAPVLLEIGYDTTVEISRALKLPADKAREALQAVKNERSIKHNGLEMKLIEMFSVFINEQKIKKETESVDVIDMPYVIKNSEIVYSQKIHNKKPTLLIALCVISCTIVLCSVIIITSNQRHAIVAPSQPFTSEEVTPKEVVPKEVTPKEVTPEEVTPEEVEKLVVITKTGARYHTPTCGHVINKEGTLTITEIEAIGMKLTPCSVCNPDKQK